MGGLTPTLGVTGTVMGLIHVLSHLDNPADMGPAVATAFLATLYGVASANLFFIPIARKLHARSQQEMAKCEMITAGIKSLQAGEPPTVLKEHLRPYLTPQQQAQMVAAAEHTSTTGADNADESIARPKAA
jgi:chemotaxis protein MotA